jgi:protease-4
MRRSIHLEGLLFVACLLGAFLGAGVGWPPVVCGQPQSEVQDGTTTSSSASAAEAEGTQRPDGDQSPTASASTDKANAEADTKAEGDQKPQVDEKSNPEDKPASDSNSPAGQATVVEAKAGGEAAKQGRSVTIVSLGLSGSLAEGVAPPGLFGELQRNLRQTIDRLDRAAADDEISAVVLRLRNPAIGRGKLNELRQAIQRLRRGGKKVYADLELAMPADYLIACACDQIIMPESGNLVLPGVRAEVMFYKDLFDKLGVKADMLQVGDFKGAAEPYTRTGMSDEFRRQYELVIDDLYDQMVDTIATDRNLNRDEVKRSIDQALFTAEQAKQAGLIDLVAYEDQSRRELGKSLSADSLRIVRNYGRKKVDTDFSGMSGMFKFFELLSGSASKGRASQAKKVAVVYAVGAIMTGSSQSDLWGGQSLGSDTLVGALRQAEQDDTVAGIVLRIDSPGGSALASDRIWRQVRQCEKPLVASMGDIAASGGYYIAMGCDKIVAEPGTLTGSIGVVGGKMALAGLMNKVGLTTDVISRGKNSGLFSSDQPFSESERDVFHRSMESIYEQFTRKAAEGRNMDLERLKELAGGRIWTGKQAQQKGLVDEVGTLDDAVQLVRRLAGLSEDDELDLIILPKPKTFFEQLIEGPDADVQTPDLLQQVLPFAGSDATTVWQSYRLMQEPFLLWLPYRVTIR